MKPKTLLIVVLALLFVQPLAGRSFGQQPGPTASPPTPTGDRGQPLKLEFS